ncbi:MAG: hypothetical protein QXX41_07880 [Nitrososphaerota archaeon]
MMEKGFHKIVKNMHFALIFNKDYVTYFEFEFGHLGFLIMNVKFGSAFKNADTSNFTIPLGRWSLNFWWD